MGYLIRTGSMKSKDIKHANPVKDRDFTTMPGSHYASYLLQAGCFLWKGRTFQKDSYIVQRKEKKMTLKSGDIVQPSSVYTGATVMKMKRNSLLLNKETVHSSK